MTTLYRIRTLWTGFAGAPGYTNMYFGTTDPLQAGAQEAGQACATFWNAIKGFMPDDVSLTLDTAVALIEDVTGQQTGELALTGLTASNVGTSTGGFFGPTGACVSWGTGTFLYGRRVKGRTYLVPLAASASNTTGGLDTTARTTIQTAASTLVSGPGQLVVYTRPREAKSAEESPTGKAITARPGSSSLVTSAVVRDRAAVLRSRRD